MIKISTAAIGISALCIGLAAQAKPLATSEQTQALTQLQAFQKLLRNKDISALSKQINPAIYQRDHIAAGDAGPDLCSAGDTTIKMNENAVKKCSKNILQNLSDLNRIQVDPAARQFKQAVYAGKKDFCKQTYKGRFAPSGKADQNDWGNVPGILITATSDYNPANPESDEDGCVALNRYFFTFRDGKLILDKVQRLP